MRYLQLALVALNLPVLDGCLPEEIVQLHSLVRRHALLVLRAAALAAGVSDQGPPDFCATFGTRFHTGYLGDLQGNEIVLISSNPDKPGRDGRRG